MLSCPSSTQEGISSNRRPTVSFNYNNGEESLKQTVDSGSVISRPPDRKKDQYIFGGWYKDATWTDPWIFKGDSPDIVTQDITLHAKWIEIDAYWEANFDVSYHKDHVVIVEIKDKIKKEVQEITIPDFYQNKAVTSIGLWAFKGCKALTNITLPASLESIGQEAFAESGLTSIILPASVTMIERGAFEESNLTSITISDRITVINDWTFRRCRNLMKIVLPASLKTIGKGAFYECSNLTSIIIPDGVTLIDNWGFFQCDNLEEVIMKNSIPPKVGKKIFGRCDKLTTIQVPADSVNSYKTAPGWSEYKDKIIAVQSERLL